jgi:hypothetical protein
MLAQDTVENEQNTSFLDHASVKSLHSMLTGFSFVVDNAFDAILVIAAGPPRGP